MNEISDKAGEMPDTSDDRSGAGDQPAHTTTEKPDTAAAVLDAARELFALHGYDGTSVRAITSKAGANLGAVTYHFGCKESLYLAAFVSSVHPLIESIAAVRAEDGDALDRIEAALRGAFAHLDTHREVGPLLMQKLSLNQPIPPPLLAMIAGNIRTIAGIIEAGQREGCIIEGDPILLALSVVAQPLYLTWARQPLREAIDFNRDDPETQARVVDHVVAFVRRGLAADRRSP
jgi:AcrR family transcriptional regulator